MTTSAVPRIENRADAEAFLDERIGRGVQPGLNRIKGLLAYMDHPETAYPSIHIAGTNGKTSVSRMVQEILGAHGLATGGFTSPHLHAVEERFSIHGVRIDSHDFTDAVRDIAWFVVGYENESDELVTYFEVTAALAFSIFSTAAVDVAVVEVGLGGRLDATNVIDGAVSVVTGIDIDHTEFLGDSIAEIAGEKVAIVSDHGTLVTGPLPADASDVVERRVDESKANWIRADHDYGVSDARVAVGGWQAAIDGVYARYADLYLPLHGRHQVTNLATAIATSEMFLGRSLDPELVEIAAAAMTMPGRLEIVRRHPLVLVDGAHNEQGMRGLAQALSEEFPELPWRLVLGVRGDRSVGGLVEPLRGLVSEVHTVAADDPASIAPSEVAAAARAALAVEAVEHDDVASGVAAAIESAGTDGAVAIAGSLYVAGEARSTFEGLRDHDGEAHQRFEAIVDFDDDGSDAGGPVALEEE